MHSLRHLSTIIGKLYETLPAIEAAPLQIRYLQQDLIQAQRKKYNYSHLVTISTDSKMELKWWINNLTLIKGSPVHLQNPEIIIYSNASSHQEWGAAMEGGPSTGASWSLKEKNRYHINELELIVAEIAIKHLRRKGKSHQFTCT